MRIKTLCASILICSLFLAASASVFAGGERSKVPRVAYLAPNDESTVDLSGKDVLTFKWKSQPIPAGGRTKFRFKVFRGFSYEVVAKEELDRGVFSADVPASKFEDGSLYTWSVQQRDGANMIWSVGDAWSFKVKK